MTSLAPTASDQRKHHAHIRTGHAPLGHNCLRINFRTLTLYNSKLIAPPHLDKRCITLHLLGSHFVLLLGIKVGVLHAALVLRLDQAALAKYLFSCN